MFAVNMERIVIRLAIAIVVLAAVAGVVSVTPSGRAFVERFGGSSTCEPNCPSPIDQAEAALQRGDVNSAKQFAAQAVTASPPDASIDYRAGNVQLGAGDENAASADYLAGERHGPTYPWNFIALGQLYSRQGKFLDADANLRAAIGIAPKLQFLHYDLGTVELREGLGAAALADFEAELKLSPGYLAAIQGKATAAAMASARGAIAVRGRPSVGPRKIAQTRPLPSPSAKLLIHILVAPSPSPTPSPTLTPTPTPAPTPESTPTPAPAATRVAHKLSPKIVASAASHAKQTRPKPLESSSPPPDLAGIASDARGYLLGVAQDLSFTRALPAADMSDSPAQLEAKITAARAKPDLLRLGAGALLQGDLGAAASAFSTAASLFPTDWQPVYLAGLTAQARGDDASARSLFATAARIGGARPEPYTSLAIEALSAGDVAGALADARRAGALDPSYEPARFTAGMLAILSADAPLARTELQAAIALGGAPDRTGYFFNQAGG
jgi:tetratricopeptide (TPR) repeat protein